MEDEGIIDEDHADLIQSALSLGTKTVYDIMTPRVDMVAIDITNTTDEILEKFFDSQYSRVPVYEGDKDSIIGVLQEKDFLAAVIKDKDSVVIEDLIQAPLYVTKTMKVDDLIYGMQEAKKHFAIVSDEYGGTSGIVTMEDALEELVGEIYDEFDYEEDDLEIKELQDNVYEMGSEVEIEDLLELLSVTLPNVTYATVGGFVYDLTEGLPEVGGQVSVEARKTMYQDEKVFDIIYLLTFEIIEVENRRIRRLKLHVTQQSIIEHD